MNFNQWRAHADKGSVARITYVCGDQPALVELVVDDIKKILDVPVIDYVEVSSVEAFWEISSQYPLKAGANRLTVVRDAELIVDWSYLSEWIEYSRSIPNNYIIFVASQADAPAVFTKGKKQGYQEHIELIRTKGKFIKCSTPNDEDLVKWIQTYGLNPAVAEHLVERTSGDVTTILNVLRKVHIWNGSPSSKAIDLLCEELALDPFSDYLILKDKKNAYLALQNMSESERAKIISQLDYRLDMLMEIGKHVRRRAYDGDIAANTGIKIFLIKRFKSAVKDYDNNKIKYHRQLLAVIDAAWRDGNRTGVMESLIALW
jgi:DNA polymerase III delta subunit